MWRKGWGAWVLAGALCGWAAVAVHAEGPEAAPPVPAGAGAPHTLRVASINMWGIPHVSTHIDARFAALADRLNAGDLDVVGLQEVWADGPRMTLRDAVRGRFPYQADFQSETGGSGLLILSRWPILERYFEPFPVNGKPWKPWHGDWWGRKGVGIVLVEAPGESVWFATTHLHARYSPRPPGGDEMDDEYAYDRWHQTHVVRATVSRYAREAPAIVVGDFNFTPLAACYRVLRTLRPGRGAVPSDSAWTDARAPSPLRRIDHIWVRPGVTQSWAVVTPTHDCFEEPVPVAGDAPQPLSDHRAVRATLVRVAADSSTAPFQCDPEVDTPIWQFSPRRGLALTDLQQTHQAGGGAVMFLLSLGVLGAAAVAGGWRIRSGPAWVRGARLLCAAGGVALAVLILRTSWHVAAVRVAAYEAWEAAGPAEVRHLR